MSRDISSANGRKFSPLERKSLEHLIRTGASSKDIAAAVGATEHGVITPITRLINKVGCENRTQLALWAHGLWPPKDGQP